MALRLSQSVPHFLVVHDVRETNAAGRIVAIGAEEKRRKVGRPSRETRKPNPGTEKLYTVLSISRPPVATKLKIQIREQNRKRDNTAPEHSTGRPDTNRTLVPGHNSYPFWLGLPAAVVRGGLHGRGARWY